MSTAIAGTLNFNINGQVMPIDAAITIGSSSVERESKVGANAGNGYYGYTEKNVPAYIEADIVYLPGMNINALSNLTGAVIQADLINGTSCVLNDAVQTLSVQLNAITGVFKLRFEGSTLDWYGNN